MTRHTAGIRQPADFGVASTWSSSILNMQDIKVEILNATDCR